MHRRGCVIGGIVFLLLVAVALFGLYHMLKKRTQRDAVGSLRDAAKAAVAALPDDTEHAGVILERDVAAFSTKIESGAVSLDSAMVVTDCMQRTVLDKHTDPTEVATSFVETGLCGLQSSHLHEAIRMTVFLDSPESGPNCAEFAGLYDRVCTAASFGLLRMDDVAYLTAVFDSVSFDGVLDSTEVECLNYAMSQSLLLREGG
jgi:hypothetical protein